MRLITDPGELASLGPSVFVPTMGALHAGHASLIRIGASEAERRKLSGGCVVSIFVNPTQFNDPSDFEKYPRTMDADLLACEGAGASAVFAPSVEAVYPPGEGASVVVLPPVATAPGLEDRFRPGHFEGVYRVVRRLFDLVKPVAAVFGEKDWQQLRVISAMVEREGLGVEIVPGETVREGGGLAMSSRNKHLRPEDRGAALSLSRALCAAGREGDPAEAERVMEAMMREAGAEPEYAVVRDAETLLPIGAGHTGLARALVAAKVGPTRLLDNAPWPSGGLGVGPAVL